MRGGWQVVLKLVRYSARSVLGGVRDMQKRVECAWGKDWVKEGDLGVGGVSSQHKENIKSREMNNFCKRFPSQFSLFFSTFASFLDYGLCQCNTLWADQTCLCAKLFRHMAPFMTLKEIIAERVNNASSPPSMIHREEAGRCVNDGY